MQDDLFPDYVNNIQEKPLNNPDDFINNDYIQAKQMNIIESAVSIVMLMEGKTRDQALKKVLTKDTIEQLTKRILNENN